MARAPAVPEQLDAMRAALEWFIASPEPATAPMLVAVEDFTLTLDDGTVETFTGGQDRIVADHELVTLAGAHRFRPVSAAEDGTACMPLSQIADEDPDLARRELARRARSMRGHRSRRAASAPAHHKRPVVRPRSRGRRERHVARTTSGSDSGDPDPADPEPPRRRRFVVDDHYLVVAVVA